MTAMPLERLESELAESLRCATCAAGGLDAPASHVVVYRQGLCDGGGIMRAASPDLLVCAAHAEGVRTARITSPLVCSACGRDVQGEPYWHVVAAVESLTGQE